MKKHQPKNQLLDLCCQWGLEILCRTRCVMQSQTRPSFLLGQLFLPGVFVQLATGSTCRPFEISNGERLLVHCHKHRLRPRPGSFEILTCWYKMGTYDRYKCPINGALFGFAWGYNISPETNKNYNTKPNDENHSKKHYLEKLKHE